MKPRIIVSLLACMVVAVPSVQIVGAEASHSQFHSVAAGASENVYAVGFISGTGTYDFGGGITATGAHEGSNMVLVAYDSTGTAQWARTVTSGDAYSELYSVAADSCANVYAAGYIEGTEVFDFGDAVDTVGGFDGWNLVVARYEDSGTALWARSVAGTSVSVFLSVAADFEGSVYAAGDIQGPGTYDFYGSIEPVMASSGTNGVIVKYEPSGDVAWAQSVSASASLSSFQGVAVDPSGNGNAYAAGYVYGTDTYDFGGNVTAAGAYAASRNAVLVKYDRVGAAQWARTLSAAAAGSRFAAATVDSAGNVYAAGEVEGAGTYDFGGGVAVTVPAKDLSPVLVKYDSSGAAQWARTVSSGTLYCLFSSVAVDSGGNVYAAGLIQGTEAYTFGEGVTARGANGGYNLLVVKYNSSGAALWARTVSAGTSYSLFSSVAVDSGGNVYAAGFIKGTGAYDFGRSVSIAAADSDVNKAVVVKYDPSGAILWARTVN